MKKIIFVLERSLFFENHIEAYDLNYFKEKGYKIEIWSLASWKFHLDMEKTEDNICGYQVTYINSPERMDCLIENAGDVLFFMVEPYHAFDAISGYIRKQIKKNGYQYCNIGEETGPSQVNVQSKLPNNQRLFKVWMLGRIFKETIINLGRIIYHCLKYILGTKRKRTREKKIIADLCSAMCVPVFYPSIANFMPLRVSLLHAPQTCELLLKKNIIVDAKDYYKYIGVSESESLIDEPYIVFIDQALPQNTQKTSKGALIEDERQYYNSINHFFCSVEELLGCKVVIAAHPKGLYKGDEYDGRKIIFGKTAELIMHSKMVIVLFSTSISYVLLAKKDFMQISVNQLLKKDYYDNIEEYYHYLEVCLGVSTLDLTANYKKSEISNYINHYDECKFKHYIERFVCVDVKEKQQKSFGEIVLNTMIK